jgi:hypothetical protein
MGKGWKDGGEECFRPLVKFEMFVQALLQQIVRMAFPARAVNNKMFKFNQVLDSAQ